MPLYLGTKGVYNNGKLEKIWINIWDKVEIELIIREKLNIKDDLIYKDRGNTLFQHIMFITYAFLWNTLFLMFLKAHYIYPGTHKLSLSISHFFWDPQTLPYRHYLIYLYFPFSPFPLSLFNSSLSFSGTPSLSVFFYLK